MECRSCRRFDKRFYCNKCIANRASDHASLRQQLLASLSVAHGKATVLLSPPVDSDVFGVGLERELRAEKYALAVKLRDTRVSVEKLRLQAAADKERLVERRLVFAQRRSNLSQAQHLLDALSTVSTNPNPLPSSRSASLDSLQSLSSQLSDLHYRHLLLLTRIDAAQNILIREVLSVYGFSRSERPLPSPFKSGTSSSSSSQSEYSDHLPTAMLSYRLAQLPVPSLADLSTLSPTLLAASLSHLLHLTRLLALYLSVALPFTPLPSLFGPGRPGVRAAPGYGKSSQPSSYPVFPSRTSKSKAAAASGGTNGKDRAAGVFGMGGEQSGGREHEGAMREMEKQEERMKAVVGGALGLAYDLAFIASKRGSAVVESDLSDVGALLAKAVGIGVTNDARRSRGTAQEEMDAPFLLDFDAILSRQTTPTTLRLLQQARRSGAVEGSEEEWDIV